MKRVSTTKQQRQAQLKRNTRQQRAHRRTTTAPQRRAARASTGVDRRDFLKQGAGAGLALALSPLLNSCGGDDDSGPPAGKEVRTLFVNLAHENHAGKSYFFEGGGQSHRLTRVADKPHVLARERRANNFLSAVPDDQITHHIENVNLPVDSVAIIYVGADIDQSAGTWQMASINLVIPTQAVKVAYARARAGTPTDPLPMSAARRKYGLPAAQTETDLIEETALLDTSNHAATLIGSHPDLMGLEATAAATVQHNHVARSIDTILLSSKIASLGPAMPQQTPGTPNSTGWASLQPLFNADGSPARLKLGPNAGRLQYHTVLHPDVRALTGKGAVTVTPGVKNDESLGADITTLKTPQDYTGMLWYRRDGRPNVNQSPSSGFRATNALMTLKQQGPQSGLDTSATMTTNADGSISVTVTATNWYLRYLGIFLQFLDGDTVLNLADIPEYNAKTIIDPSIHNYPGNPNYSFDKATVMYAGLVPAITTIMGIPLSTPGGAGSGSITFNKPAKATTVRILTGGLGAGSDTYPDTTSAGIGMTAFFCYGVTALCGAAGAGAKYPLVIEAIATSLDKIANALATALVDDLSGSTPATAQFWSDEALSIAVTIIGTQGVTVLSTMIGLIGLIITESEVEKAVPIIGIVSQVISGLIAAADIIITSVDVGKSPWTYVNDLVFTYDLSVSLTPDVNHNTFPAAADTYKVTAMLDNGTPYVQTLKILTAAPSSLPAVKFTGIPLGGNINVSVSFAQSATVANADDVLLGRGTTGLVVNDGSAKAIQIEEIKFPIGPTTKYEHKTKTFLDDSDHHVWAIAPAPTENQANHVCGLAGTICDFRGITVRQGTQAAQGYLGYAWQGQNSDASKAPSCQGGGVGQLDQLTNLNTGINAAAGEAGSQCGINVGGVRVAYNLLTHGTSNFYLDTSDANAPVIRQVTLDGTPQFASPASNQAWGVLNMPSDALLLHPAGHLISINSVNHKIETHQIPKAALADSNAKVMLLAQVRSGKGSRPGLLDSPVAAAVSADGHILILEAGNNRIHALDLGANPVPYFKQQPAAYFLTLDQTPPSQNWQHLDMAVEYTGFIYVLSYRTDTFEYQMNIYHPDQAGTSPIGSTPTVMNAARLTVDFWRSVYSLNYEVIPRLNPSNTTPPPVTEPSVSLWTPCNVGQTCS